MKGALAGRFGSSAGVAAWEARAAKWHSKTTEELDADAEEDATHRGLVQPPIVVNLLEVSSEYGCSRTHEVIVPLNGAVACVCVPLCGVSVHVVGRACVCVCARVACGPMLAAIANACTACVCGPCEVRVRAVWPRAGHSLAFGSFRSQCC